MNRSRLILSVAFLIVLAFSCKEKACGCFHPESPLKGDWNLAKITYGLSQKTVTAAEAGYSETLSFNNFSDVNGNYRRVRNGVPIETIPYSYNLPHGGNTEGIIFFPADTTQQSFRLSDNKLYLTERIPQGAVLADGSIYEYQR